MTFLIYTFFKNNSIFLDNHTALFAHFIQLLLLNLVSNVERSFSPHPLFSIPLGFLKRLGRVIPDSYPGYCSAFLGTSAGEVASGGQESQEALEVLYKMQLSFSEWQTCWKWKKLRNFTFRQNLTLYSPISIRPPSTNTEYFFLTYMLAGYEDMETII